MTKKVGPGAGVSAMPALGPVPRVRRTRQALLGSVSTAAVAFCLMLPPPPVGAQGIPGLGTGLPATGVPTPGRQMGGIPLVGVPVVAPLVLDGMQSGGFMVLAGTPQVVSDAVFMNFRAMGGNGSGGGLGAGGAFFVGAGSSLVVNNATFVNNWAIGGNGGAAGGVTGGTLNGGAALPGAWDALLLAGQAAAIPMAGLPGVTPFDPPTGAMMGDGNGNGLPGTVGGNGLSVPGGLSSPVPLMAGGAGGQGGMGQAGWSYNPKLMADVSNAELDVSANSINVAVMTAEIVAWAAAAVATGGASAGAGAAASAGLAEAIISLTTASMNLSTATANLAAWNAAMVAGSVGVGGPGGRGGVGGNGSFGLPGGPGGNGGMGGVGGNGIVWGVGGDGGPAGISGFGAGGSQGGNAGGDGLLSHFGAAGPGGIAGFGGGVGSSGTGLGVSSPTGGGGGSGLGGAIFIQDGALNVTFTGNTRFSGNGVLAGGSLNGGASGDSAGSVIFLHGQANVNFWPDAVLPGVNTIVVEGANAIADNSSTKFYAGSSSPQLAGGSVTVGAGLTIFAPGTGNTYSGNTHIGNALMGFSGTPFVPAGYSRLRADDGDGLPQTSKIVFDNGGVLETSGTFGRFVGTMPGQVEWQGSGGFAAVGGDLTVRLNGGLDINWGVNGAVPYGSALVLGSPTATHNVTLANSVFTGLVPLVPVQIQVVPTLGDLTNGIAPNSNRAILTGSIYGAGMVVINDLLNPLSWGTLEMRSPNLYLGPTVLNGGRLELSGLGSIATSTQLLITNPLAVFDISRIGVANLTGGAPLIDTASIVSLSGVGTVTLGDRNLLISGPILAPSLFAGTIEGTGNVSLGTGLQLLGGTNTYTGSTTIGILPGTSPLGLPLATLMLTGAGDIEASSGVHINSDGRLDIATNLLAGGARIRTLYGSGEVNTGALTLTLTQAGGTFSGNILGAGNLVLERGAEALTGTNAYTGNTTIGLGTALTDGVPLATLKLEGAGTIAQSARVTVRQDGLFDISGVTAPGTSIVTLAGQGAVALGDRRLTLTGANDTFEGAIGGTQGITVAAGHETLTGTNTYGGRTIVDAGARLSLAAGGAIANSSGVTANGEFHIGAVDASGVSVVTLDGSGLVTLGAKRLTLTNASETFAGSIVGTGGLTVAGGHETLIGTNTYTGRTNVNAGATLVLSGTGAIETSQGVTAAGIFDIAGTTGGARIRTLDGSGEVRLGAAYLTLTHAGETFAGVISGTGGLTVNTGTETLTGTNLYTGTTRIDAPASLVLTGTGSIAQSGEVRANGLFDIAGTSDGARITTLSGNGAVELGGRTLAFTNAATTFGGVIQGTGGIVVTGGHQSLSGTNTFTGRSEVQAGAMLSLLGDGTVASSAGLLLDGLFNIAGTNTGAAIRTLAGTGTVDLGSRTLEITQGQGTDSTFSGQIGGTGSLAVTGGHVVLEGASTYTGGTLVRNATLTVNADAAMGAAAGQLVLSNARLNTSAGFTTGRAVTLDGVNTINTRGNTLTVNGVVSGGGGLVADGGGRINLTNANSYSGGTRITGQTTVAIATDAALGSPNSALYIESGKLLATGAFNSGRPITIGLQGVIDADGHSLSLNGPITLEALGNTVLFSGTANITGPWRVDSNGLSVPDGATLGGVGIVTQSTMVSGTLSPGASPGTLGFTAPVALAPSATFAVDIDGTGTGTGAGSHDRVLVAGAGNTFTMAGVLAPQLRGITGSATNTYTPPVATSFRIVEAEGGVLGSASSLVQPAGLQAGTRMDALYQPDAITLYVTPDDYRDLRPHGVAGLTPNQREVGTGLNAMRSPAGVRVAADATEALDVLFRLTPQAMPATFNRLAGTVYGDGLMTGLSSSRLFGDAISDQAAARAGAASAARAAEVSADRQYTVWAGALGRHQQVGADGNTSHHSSTGGAVAGADLRISDAFNVGIALGYTGAQVSSRDTAAKANVDLVHAAVRGGWTSGNFWVDGQAGLALAETRVTRELGVFGTRARGNASGFGLNAGVEAGIRQQLSSWTLLPSVSFRVDELGRDSLTETGAGALNLVMRSEDAMSARGALGVRAERRFDFGSGYDLAINARLQLTHEFGDVDTVADGTFSAARGATMRFTSARVGREAGVIGLGAAMQMPAGVSAFVSYAGEVRDNASSHSGTAGVRYAW